MDLPAEFGICPNKVYLPPSPANFGNPKIFEFQTGIGPLPPLIVWNLCSFIFPNWGPPPPSSQLGSFFLIIQIKDAPRMEWNWISGLDSWLIFHDPNVPRLPLNKAFVSEGTKVKSFLNNLFYYNISLDQNQLMNKFLCVTQLGLIIVEYPAPGLPALSCSVGANRHDRRSAPATTSIMRLPNEHWEGVRFVLNKFVPCLGQCLHVAKFVEYFLW